MKRPLPPDFVLLAMNAGVLVYVKTERGFAYIKSQGINLKGRHCIELCAEGADIFAEYVEAAGLTYKIELPPKRPTKH